MCAPLSSSENGNKLELSIIDETVFSRGRAENSHRIGLVTQSTERKTQEDKEQMSQTMHMIFFVELAVI